MDFLDLGDRWTRGIQASLSNAISDIVINQRRRVRISDRALILQQFLHVGEAEVPLWLLPRACAALPFEMHGDSRLPPCADDRRAGRGRGVLQENIFIP